MTDDTNGGNGENVVDLSARREITDPEDAWKRGMVWKLAMFEDADNVGHMKLTVDATEEVCVTVIVDVEEHRAIYMSSDTAIKLAARLLEMALKANGGWPPESDEGE